MKNNWIIMNFIDDRNYYYEHIKQNIPDISVYKISLVITKVNFGAINANNRITMEINR